MNHVSISALDLERSYPSLLFGGEYPVATLVARDQNLVAFGEDREISVVFGVLHEHGNSTLN
ncbi:hypothetical protein GII33_17180 [Gordonia pseudamarae]|uniref:Uncharacterized protein n=1 Tax=Gordonia pseudamarae TaxID=2831662 RepID=A0ABX6IK90_9ACTN|nr:MULTISPECIES: hypothetical protein [Gordonia]MBD0020568.1 hypothetical protein [Gordonia sp. (in: high G+C Gram-positive bacteria)]QHN27425.1 hypothetical protein GII33_17180 [Gordonia pseudamarae]QHN36309.1 hypothetical protein GII31_16955 [Gordonia pseudamarae]